jgi:hypothetical protein
LLYPLSYEGGMTCPRERAINGVTNPPASLSSVLDRGGRLEAVLTVKCFVVGGLPVAA